MFFEMQRFTQQMGQTETKIECGIPEMNHFVIQQHEVAFMHQDVFRTVIPMDQRDAVPPVFLDQGE